MSDPMFVMSKYANKGDLYEAKAKYYVEKSDRLEAEVKAVREEIDFQDACNTEQQATITELTADNLQLRSLACRAIAKQPYLDDGELQDNSFPYPIDFLRDSVDEIEKRLTARMVAALQEDT